MRQRRTSKAWFDKRQRLIYLQNTGLVIPINNLKNHDEINILEIRFPLKGKEFWFVEGSLEDAKLISTPNTSYEILSYSKLIIDDNGKPYRNRKVLEEIANVLVRLRVRW